MDNNTSKVLSNIIKKARQVGDTKVGKDGKTRYWTETKPGKFDWRKKNPLGNSTTKTTSSGSNKMEKLKNFLGKTSVDKLIRFSNTPENDPSLRQMAYDELVKRGEDVSDIDLETGRYKEMKDTFSLDDIEKPTPDGEIELVSDWQDPEFIKRNYGGLKTKQQRIEYDNFAYQQKIHNPNYKTPQEEIHSMNILYAQFLKTKSPLMIVSGGAGVGKTFNLHLVAKVMRKKQFDPAIHTAVNPTFSSNSDEDDEDYYEEEVNSDYDYVEVPEVKSDLQLVQLLKEHNGKILVFDDTDNILKSPDALGIMKKATASSGKRIVGKKSSNEKTNVDPFEFTGKILFLSNMSQAEFTKNEHLNAIYSRALKKDIYFTKQEQLNFIDGLKHKFEFSGLDRLEDMEEDMKERDEVFKVLKENIEYIDPAKFNVRSMKEALEVKRAYDNAKNLIEDDPVMGQLVFGNVDGVWIDEVRSFLVKGANIKQHKLEKAIDFFNL